MRPSTPPIGQAATGAPEPPETIVVDSHRVWCDGGGGALGHPRVYLEMGAAGFVECGYCDRRFVAAHAHGDDEREVLAPAAYKGPDTAAN
jgi:uncharacterized Zn-finger protein